MNILLLCDEYPPCKHGGIGTVTRLQARELVKKGHKVVVCGFYPWYRKAQHTEVDNGVTVYRFHYGNRILLQLSKHKLTGDYINIKPQFTRYINKVKTIISKHKIDVMEIPDYNEIFRYSGPKKVSFPDFGIPKVVKIHGGDSFFNYIKKEVVTHDIIYLKEKRLIEEADSLIAISEFSRSVIKTVFKYNKYIPVIYNGVSIDREVSYKDDPQNIRVIFAGSFKEKKGVFSLIGAWKNVVSQIPQAHLYIYGKGSKKTLRYLDEIISDQVKESIHLMGFADIEELYKVYSNSTCAVFPSFAESFGMAPIESMLTGCPTIFTKRSSGPELISHGEEGLLVDPDDFTDISESIIYLIRNRKRALEMGLRGALKVRKYFDISLIADQHILLYDSLIQKRINI